MLLHPLQRRGSRNLPQVPGIIAPPSGIRIEMYLGGFIRRVELTHSLLLSLDVVYSHPQQGSGLVAPEKHRDDALTKAFAAIKDAVSSSPYGKDGLVSNRCVDDLMPVLPGHQQVSQNSPSCSLLKVP